MDGVKVDVRLRNITSIANNKIIGNYRKWRLENRENMETNKKYWKL